MLTGTGTGAVDLDRSKGVITTAGNRLVGWEDTSLRHVWTKKLMQPMTTLWLMIALLIILSAFRSRGRTAIVEHPYAHQMAHHGPIALPDQHVIDLTGAASGLVRP